MRSLRGGGWGTSSKAKRQFVPSLRAGSACMRNWSSSSRRSTTSATELCVLWSSKRLGLLASPVTFSRERDGVYVWVGGLIARLTVFDIDEARAAAERLAQERE